ncbi:MAG: FlxA-like family protein [Acidobacteriota bacterium]
MPNHRGLLRFVVCRDALPWTVGVVFAMILTGVPLAARPTDAGASEEKRLEEKLAELERRLEELEKTAREEDKTSSEDPLTVQVEELRRQLDVLAEEVDRLRSGDRDESLTEEQRRAFGLGASAARIYERRRGVSFAGYGEMLYENFAETREDGVDSGKTDQIDFLRAILYTGYRFSDRLLFNSEIEFEHASTGEAGEVSVEFAYLEYLLNENFGIRGGLLLVPMGWVNEYHEPNAFFGSLRPFTERVILPTTWRDAGFGLAGRHGPFEVRAYVVNGLKATGFGGDGIRGGRQQGSKAKAEDFAFVGRLDFSPEPGLVLGGSLYHGGADQGELRWQERPVDVSATIFDIHGQWRWNGWDVRGLFAQAALDNAAEINLARGLDGAAAVAERMRGGYFHVGFNLLRDFSEDLQLSPYYRLELVNTQAKMPAGFVAAPRNDWEFHTFGLEFRPLSQVVIKGDYQWTRNEAKTGVNQFNIGLGYAF